MWSIPKIKEMNARAAANRRQIEREAKLKTSRKHPCECCDRPSTRHRWPADKPFTGLFTKAGDSRVLPVTFSKRYHLPRWAGNPRAQLRARGHILTICILPSQEKTEL